uniref:G-protein coupled receptors family 1 profile domain-containing protein n=1 Tax=Gopherus evgoodei TaxID=1825980 RepID=A0A8C4Y760_9SAUR
IDTEQNNQTVVREFMFLGFTSQWVVKMSLFLVFLIIYTTSLIANSLIVALTLLDPQLHTPMYFFLLGNYTIITSITVPKLLANFLSRSITITVNGCVTQFYFFFSLGATDYFLLAVMVFDRYLAICSPLRYTTIMNHRLCFHLSASSWIDGFLSLLLSTILISQLSFCGPQKINHFFCDSDPILKFSFLLTTSSYVNIIANIMKLIFAKALKKTFSTCASHLTVVTIYYGTIIFTYVRPPSIYSFGLGKVVSVFYCVITPLLNPLIYTLRNKDVQKAVWKSFTRMRR